MNTLVFGNQKGGTGKSTLAVLYAHFLAERCGERVCVIDLDSQGNASKSLAAFDSRVQAQTLFAGNGAKVPVAAAERGSISLLGGSSGLVDIERLRPEVALPAFRQHISGLADRFDTCVIDTPPALGLRLSAALIAGNAVVCPIELEEYSIDGVTHMLRTVFGVRRRYNPALRLAGIVANRFNPHSLRQKEALMRLIADYAEFIVPAHIGTRTAIPEALAAGIPVWRLPRSSAREAAAEVLAVFRLLRQRTATEAATVDAAGVPAEVAP